MKSGGGPLESNRLVAVDAFIRSNPLLVRGDYVGCFERIDGGWAVGWVTDRRVPQRPVTVELVVDGQTVNAALANHPRQDVFSAGLGVEVCGFRLSVPNTIALSAKAAAAVRIANTTWELPGSPQTIGSTVSAQHRLVRGDVNATNRLTVRGWAFDPWAPNDR